mmetsp:Transcript_122046/g.340270  ORF Transcript_122046/g.340270 Transcript_122046/m.340270 type:complete len:280 (+) Transcript_122046:90-929(+)
MGVQSGRSRQRRAPKGRQDSGAHQRPHRRTGANALGPQSVLVGCRQAGGLPICLRGRHAVALGRRRRGLVDGKDLLQVGALHDGALGGVPRAIAQGLLALEAADELRAIRQTPLALDHLALLPLAHVGVPCLGEDVGARAVALVGLPHAGVDVAVGILKGALTVPHPVLEVPVVVPALLVGHAPQPCLLVVVEMAIEDVAAVVGVDALPLALAVRKEALVLVPVHVPRSALAGVGDGAGFLGARLGGQGVHFGFRGQVLLLFGHGAAGQVRGRALGVAC